MHEDKERQDSVFSTQCLSYIYKCRHGHASHSTKRCEIYRYRNVHAHINKWVREKAAVTLQFRECFCARNHNIFKTLFFFFLSPCCLFPLPSPISPSTPSPLSPFRPLPALFLSSSASSPASSPYQPLPVSSAGIGEGEGKPGRADGALLQGAAGTCCLWQHQERSHARADVRLCRINIYAWDLTSFCD